MKIFRTVLVAAVLTQAGAAGAEYSEYPRFSLNGFGTLGVVRSNEDQADFVSSIFAPEGAGYSGTWSPKVDSRLGLQLSGNFSPRLSGVVQVISEQRYDGTYTPSVEWANLGFDVTPNLTLRVGRTLLPVFMASEYRKASYANPWARPPEEVYQLVPVTSSDGLSALYHRSFGGMNYTLQASAGAADAKVFDGSEITARRGFTIANTLQWGPTSVFAAYNQSRLTWPEINEFFDAFRFFGPEGEAIADRYDLDNKRSTVTTLGARHDPGDWFVTGEWARGRTDSFIGESEGWYATGGYRLGDFTPYLTIARVRSLSETSHPGVPHEAAAELNEILNLFLGGAAQQKRVGAGLRWDVRPGAALRFQYDYLDMDGGSIGTLVNEQPDFRRGGSASLLTLSLDFVF